MPITSTTFSAPQTIVAAKLAEIAGLNVYSTGQATVALPSVEIIWPRFERVPVDRQEKQLGAVSLTTWWGLKLRVDAESLAQSSTDALAFIGQIIGKFDANETLGTAAADGFSMLCRVINGDLDDDPVGGDSKATRSYLLTLEIQQLV